MKKNIQIKIISSTNIVLFLTVFLWLSHPIQSQNKPTQTLFSDDIWFFGLYEGRWHSGGSNITGTPTSYPSSKGIIFNNVNGVMVPTDGSGISKVNSWENSLSVSTPACSGSFVFYTSHNRVYNSKHEPMKSKIGIDGAFEGHTSNADGLAACYIGDNKYLLFSVSQDGRSGVLNYYTIDMSGDGGLGEMISSNLISTSKINESIELIPKVGTFDEYWLIYHDLNEGKIKVIAINGSNSNPIGNVVSEFPFTDGRIMYGMRSNAYFTKLLMILRDGNNNCLLFDFNPATGQLTHHYSLYVPGYTYGGTFSPNGEYWYIGRWKDSDQIDQYITATGVKVHSLSYGSSYGSGMKVGPDNKIYIEREYNGANPLHSWMAVIEKPEVAFTDIAGGGGITKDGFKLSRGGNGVGISTGLTPPWIDPPTSNLEPPTALPDFFVTYSHMPISLYPLLNDNDNEGQTNLFISNVEFAHSTDSEKGSFFIDSDNHKVVFTPNSTYPFNYDTLILDYIVKDKGIPIQMCDNSTISIVITDLKISMIDSCSFNPELIVVTTIAEHKYQWEVSSDNIQWIPISGADSPNLIIPNPIEDGTYYRIKVLRNDGHYMYKSKRVRVIKKEPFAGNRVFYQIELQD